MNRLTIRARLTLVYLALVVAAGGVLLAATYVLLAKSLSRQFGPPPPPPFDRPAPGEPVTPEQMAEFRRYAEEFRDGVRDSALASVLTRGIVALVAVAILAGVLSWFLAGRALHPVHRITATARRIAGNPSGTQGLRDRISLSGPQDEIKELADTFDGMLGRLDQAFDTQRRFVANASHELRTPLAVNRSVIEVAITRPDVSTDAVDLGRKLLDVNDRHARLVDALLTLAEGENAVPPRTAVDLAETTARVLGGLDCGGVRVRTDLPPTPTLGDPLMLERVVQNVLDNAVRHNEPAGWVEVSTRVEDGQARLVVRNSGTVVTAADAQTIFEPFRRLRSARTGTGFGLGLSIVRVIVAAHGGTAVATPLPGGGLDLTVTLPERAP